MPWRFSSSDQVRKQHQINRKSIPSPNHCNSSTIRSPPVYRFKDSRYGLLKKNPHNIISFMVQNQNCLLLCCRDRLHLSITHLLWTSYHYKDFHLPSYWSQFCADWLCLFPDSSLLCSRHSILFEQLPKATALIERGHQVIFIFFRSSVSIGLSHIAYFLVCKDRVFYLLDYISLWGISKCGNWKKRKRFTVLYTWVLQCFTPVKHALRKTFTL